MQLNYQDRIKRYINRCGITQKEFSNRVGLSHSVITSIITGRTQPTPANAAKINDFLKDFEVSK